MKNTLIKVLSFVMALTMIVGMFTVVSTAEEHVHTKGDVVYTKAANCESIGYTVYKCTGCGESFTDDVKPTTGVHTPVEVAAAAATCDTPALTAGTKCSVCDETLSGCTAVEGSKPLGHDWISKKVPASCANNEYVQHTCTRCNKTADALLATNPYKNGTVDAAVLRDTRAHAKEETAGTKLAHDYDIAVQTAPTTCVDGLSVATCKYCKATKNIAIPAVHNFVAVPNTEWSCTAITKIDATGDNPTQCSYCGKLGPNTKVKDNVKHTYTNVEAVAGDVVLAHGSTGKFVMSSKLEALGLKVGDSLYKAATCKEKGKKLGQCVCGAVSFVEIATTAHNNAWTWKVGATDVAVADLMSAAAAKLCTDAITRTKACTVCKTVAETVTVVPAANHVTEAKTVASTCTDEGYVLTTCKVCTYSTKSNFTAALGHTPGEWVTSGDCVAGIFKTQKCTTCKVELAKETIRDTGSAHEYNEGSNYILVPATCKDKAYYAYQCKYCTAKTPVEGLDPVGEVNKSNHSELVYVNNDKPYKPGAESTCTKNGVYLKTCTGCGAVIEQTAPMAEHVYGTVCSSKNIDLSAVAATCQKEGKKAGQVCVNCGLIKTPQETIAKNPHNHTGAKTAIKHYNATCIAGGYTYYATACCGYVNVPDGTPATGTHTWKENAFKAPTCDAAGNHYYKSCSVCDFVDLSTVSTAGCTYSGCTAETHNEVLVTKDYAIASLGGHKFDTKIAAVAETCTDFGNIEYYQCSRGCTVYKVNGNEVVDDGNPDNGSEINAYVTILPHGNKYMTTVTATAPTCTSTGISQSGTFCSKCEANKYVVNKLPHVMTFSIINDKTGGAYDCTKPTYKVHWCETCKAELYADEFVGGNTAHNWSATPDASATAHDKICTEGVRQAYKCVYCNQYDYRTVKAPVAHSAVVNGAFIDMSLACDQIDKWNGTTCRICNKVVGTDLTAIHTPAVADKAPTCTEDGYHVEYCVVCEEELSTPVYDKAYGHKVYASAAEAKADTAAVYNLVKFVDATETEDGYITYVCKRCMEEITLTIPAKKGMILNIAADGVAVSNNQVTVTVKASATNYVFNTIHFGIAINPAQIAFNNAKIAYNFAAIDAVTVVASGNDDYVDVLVYVPNSADGKAKNAAITGDGVAFLTLTFDVLPTANGDVAIPAEFVTATGNEPAAILLEDVLFVDEDGEIAPKKNVEFNVTELKTTMLGNVNGDRTLDAGDSIAIQTAIYDKNYNVAADFNKDGKVDLADHVAFVKFVTSKQSVVDYLAAMGIEVEAVVMNYDLKYDLDYDRAVGTDNDKALLAKAVVSYLSNVYYDEFDVTPADTLDEFIEYVALTIAYPNVRP